MAVKNQAFLSGFSVLDGLIHFTSRHSCANGRLLAPGLRVENICKPDQLDAVNLLGNIRRPLKPKSNSQSIWVDTGWGSDVLNVRLHAERWRNL